MEAFNFEAVLSTLELLECHATDSASETKGVSSIALVALFEQLVSHQRALDHFAQTRLAAHMARQRKLDETKADADKVQRNILLLVDALASNKEALLRTLKAAQAAKRKLKNSTHSTNNSDIINYARRLAKYSSPPSNPAIPSLYPPIPQDAHMKRSLLFMPQDWDAAANPDGFDQFMIQPEALMELDLMDKLIQNPAYAVADGDSLEDDLNLDFD